MPESNRPVKRDWLRYLFLSLLLLAPVYWQSRVQAGDLSSHIYNAWLAQLIETGRTQGMVIVKQTTNVLFDLMLSTLFPLVGAELAQRIAVSIAVLTFVWGAFRFTGAVAGKRPWHILPCIAMLAYGWVFHMGFFNFYLSLGLCFWALSLAWDLKTARPAPLALAALLLALAYVAHALPVVWSAGLFTYRLAAARMSARGRIYMSAGVVLALVVVQTVVGKTTFSRWSAQQIKMTTGADQMWVFDGKYYLVLAGLLILWVLLFIDIARRNGMRELVSGIPFQFCVLSAAAVFILPTTVKLPGFHHTLVYIAERMSLGVGVCVCALLAAARPRRYQRYALPALAVLFFGFLYRDEKILNRIEDRVDRVVAHLEPGQRIISAVDDLDLHVFAVTHMIDRACIGRCFSYANYEPSTAQFRIRAAPGNPHVISVYEDSWKIQTGSYIVQPGDLPLIQLILDESGQLAVRNLKAGVPCGSTSLRALGELFRIG